MSQKAWMNAYTKGSKELQARLAKVHAKNPEFQEFVKKHGFGGNLSVKQSGLQKKSSVATVKPVDQPHPESKKGPADREALIKAAAQKIRDRRLAASNRVAFGGELGGSFSLPGSGFRTYREDVNETSMPAGVIKHKQRLANRTPEELHAGFKEVANRQGKSIEDVARSTAWRHGYGKMSDHYWKKISHIKEEVELDESKAEETIKAHPGVSYYGGKSDDHFVELHKGWEMDGQRSFGNKNAAEALKTLKHVKRVQGTDESVSEDVDYKGGDKLRMRRGGWVVVRNGKQHGIIHPTEGAAKYFADNTRETLGHKLSSVLRKKAKEIAHGLGRYSYATESAANRRRVRSWDSAIMPDLKPLRVKPKVKPPFIPDKPKDNAGIIAGKNDPNYSRVRHLARLGIKKAMEK